MPIIDPLNQLRVCYAGVLTKEDAQKRIGNAFCVIEIRPAECVSDDGEHIIPATEVLFANA